MIETTSRPAPPPLEIRCPDCPICSKETTPEDGFVCEPCGAYWPYEGIGDEHGAWLEDDAEQCPATIEPYKSYVDRRFDSIRDNRYRCYLDADDHAEHRHPDHIGSRSDEWVMPA
jgi:hypothetical protein